MQYSSPQTSSSSAIAKHWPATSRSRITAYCQSILRILISGDGFRKIPGGEHLRVVGCHLHMLPGALIGGARGVA